MSLGTMLLIVLILRLIGVIPSWPRSRSWGYGPSGGIGLYRDRHHRAAVERTDLTGRSAPRPTGVGRAHMRA